MSTSLAEQLRKLATPQASLLKQDKARPSLLFDPKEAANLDRNTVFDIGLSGLLELKKIDPLFGAFEDTLFHPSSCSFERSVQTADANKKLNKNIRKFLLRLSPYFLIKSAHKTLEWLINRFRIHEYNMEDLLMLILPYHETNIFVRCVQLFNLKQPGNKWLWLEPLQKPGIHLPKNTLLNHCANDIYFYRFVCRMIVEAVNVWESKATSLTIMFNFYCFTVIGTLEYSKEITDPQVTQVLPPLLKGLGSSTPDFLAASYMITAQMIKKTKLSPKILTKLIVRIVNNTHSALRNEACLLLVLIYQSQREVLDFVPEKAAVRLSATDWFATSFGKLAEGGSFVLPLLIPLVKAILTLIQTKEDVDIYQKFAENLTENVDLTEDDAENMLITILDSFNINNIDEDDTAVPVVNDVQAVKTWFSTFIKSFETRYPNAFDKTIHGVLKAEKGQRKKVLLSLLDFMISIKHGESEIFEKLYHPNPHFRAQAVKYLVQNYNKLREKDKDLLRDSLKEKITDDVPEVTLCALQLPYVNLVELLTASTLKQALSNLTSKCIKNQQLWSGVKPFALNMLCNNDLEVTDTNTFLTLLPYLLPLNEKEISYAKLLLHTKYATDCKIIANVKSDLLKISNSDIFFDKMYTNISSGRNMPNVEYLVKNINGNIEDRDVLFKYLSMLIITFSYPENSPPQLGIRVMDCYNACIGNTKLKYFGKNFIGNEKEYTKKARKGTLALDAFLFCLKTIINRTEFHVEPKWLNLYAPDNDTKFYVALLDKLVSNSFSVNRDIAYAYVDVLKGCLEKLCSNISEKIGLLSNMLVVHPAHRTDNVDPPLQLRCIRLINSILAMLRKVPLELVKSETVIVPSLLVALSSTYVEIRQEAMQTLKSLINTKASANSYIPLLQKLLKQQQEILLDSDQIGLILYSLLSPNVTDEHDEILNNLVEIMCSTSNPPHVNAALLNILQYITTPEIFSRSCALGAHILKSSGKILDSVRSEIVYKIILQLNEHTAQAITDNSPSWEFIFCALKHDLTLMEYKKGKTTSPSVLILDHISDEIYSALSDDVQAALINGVLEITTQTENPNFNSVANKFFKRIKLNSSIILPLLIAMRDVKSATLPVRKRRSLRMSLIPTADILDTLIWKKGTAALEFIQNKKELVNSKILLPILFEVLKKCLDFEEQAAVEYTKQLLLSTILHCCESLNEKLPESVFNMEAVVQCVRASQNPQTHHHALLLLAHTASLIPEQVLLNIMAIFTFMGSSVLRHDDSYSFQIIFKIIETVIPILVKSGDQNDQVVSVLRVFSDAILDVPEHRRMPIFIKLLNTLGTEYLPAFLLLVFEGHVVHGDEDKRREKRSRLLQNHDIPKRLDIATSILLEFPPDVVINACVELIKYLRSLPVEKDGHDGYALKVFNISQHTPKQFRHYKYTVITFISGLLPSPNLVNHIAALSNEKLLDMEALFKEAILGILTYIQTVVKVTEQSVGTPQANYWKVILRHSYDILDGINALLTSEMFLLVIRGLMLHNIATVARKAMEMLNNKLQNSVSYFDDVDSDKLLELLPPLMSIVKTITNDSSTPEQELNQQTALLSLKLLVRMLSSEHPDRFKPILDFTTDIIKSRKVQGNILASVILCLGELCVNLRAHSIPAIIKFMPAVLKILKSQRLAGSPDLLLLSVLASLQKIIESLPLFLSPYLEKLLFELSILSAKYTQADDKNIAPFFNKLKSIQEKIGVVPSRIIVPVISQTYFSLIEKGHYEAVGPLMRVLTENLSTLKSSEISTILPDLTQFILGALQFRTDAKDKDVTDEQIAIVEEHVIDAVVTLILKLSETNFRPLYYRLFDWAVRSDVANERIISFYRLSTKIAENLKGLFVLFAGHIVKNASLLLDSCNTIKSENLYFPDNKICILLIDSILKTLHSVFLHDTQNFVNKERFELLMQPLVDQLENTLGGAENISKHVSEVVTPCIAQFAVSTADDALWKQLNYQILLKTRHNLPEIRLAALNCVCEVVKKLGEDFLPLLPETIPFLAELLEDEDEKVETSCQKVIQDLEKILGEPIQKYF